MQPECRRTFPLLSKLLRVGRKGVAVAAILLLAGCGQTATTIDPAPPKPYPSISLTLAYSSSVRHPELIEQFAQEWSNQTGAAVRIQRAEAGKAADIAILSPAEMPELADAGAILPVPADIRGREHPYQWDNLFQMESEKLATWGVTTYAVPLMGEGRVLVYRPDRFEAAGVSSPDKEWTWEKYLAAARSLAEKGRPSLPPLPKRADDLDAEFHLIAACYDRPVNLQSEAPEGLSTLDGADRHYTYQYRLKTARPRIDAPAFVHAFQLLQEMRSYRVAGESDDPSEAFRSGKASLCIATLENLARFQSSDSAVRNRFRVAPLPGAGFTFDLLTGAKVPMKVLGVNRMPYLGSGGWLGVVGKDCANPNVAFEFLTAFAHPEKMGAEVITAAKWGAGPYRMLHLEERTRGLWLGYDLPAKETEALIEALKLNLNTSIINHRYRLRLPNQAKHLDAFDALVRPGLQTGSADATKTLAEVNARWNDLWTGIPEPRKRAWIAMGYGFQN